MIVKKILHTGVHEDGRMDGGGAVVTEPVVRMGRAQGCGLDRCTCFEGYWLFIGLGLINGQVEGVKVIFDSKEEMDMLLDVCEVV